MSIVARSDDELSSSISQTDDDYQEAVEIQAKLLLSHIISRHAELWEAEKPKPVVSVGKVMEENLRFMACIDRQTEAYDNGVVIDKKARKFKHWYRSTFQQMLNEENFTVYHMKLAAFVNFDRKWPFPPTIDDNGDIIFSSRQRVEQVTAKTAEALEKACYDPIVFASLAEGFKGTDVKLESTEEGVSLTIPIKSVKPDVPAEAHGAHGAHLQGSSKATMSTVEHSYKESEA